MNEKITRPALMTFLMSEFGRICLNSHLQLVADNFLKTFGQGNEKKEGEIPEEVNFKKVIKDNLKDYNKWSDEDFDEANGHLSRRKICIESYEFVVQMYEKLIEPLQKQLKEKDLYFNQVDDTWKVICEKLKKELKELREENKRIFQAGFNAGLRENNKIQPQVEEGNKTKEEKH
jgi:flagellar motility protein MotE (MotC chaperone)